MLQLAAYADRLSLRPGESIRFHVASATGAPVTAGVVRVISADANPNGPGIVTQPAAGTVTELAAPGPQRVPSGSYVQIEPPDAWFEGSFSLACHVFPTRLGSGPTWQCIASRLGAGAGFALSLRDDGHLAVIFGGLDQAPLCVTDRGLAPRRWSVVWLSSTRTPAPCLSGRRRSRRAWSVTRRRAPPLPACPTAPPRAVPARCCWRPPVARTPRRISTASWRRQAFGSEFLDEGDLAALASGRQPRTAAASWDFAADVASARVPDTGAAGCHGRTVNTPVRAVTGSSWTGREMCFRHAPSEYAAIHFHDDDIDDCRWPATHAWTPPADTRSGVYALLLESGEARENVPFHVVPARGKPRARLAVLASTITYTIYGNHARPDWDVDPEWRNAWKRQVSDWGCYPHNPAEHREYGLSTYNFHGDGSGISIASWHRPMLNVRLGYLTYPDEPVRASGLRHFPADSHLVGWLEAKGIEYDLITDWELHHEGAALLADYQVLVTGSHPEYHTPQMLDALTRFRDDGGRLAYLGGNGFYWKVALDPERDGVIEIRRGEGGIRAWAAEPGEYYNQFDGRYGGLWRRNGRPPQDLTGVGFTAQGNFSGSYYRRREAAKDPRVAWLFEGVTGERIGDHGFSAHGAAGFELDRADKRLGTPVHALVVASSENHPPDAPSILVPEEMLTHITTWAGTPAPELIRADMCFFETPAGGAVFSTGSITFCGSLVTGGYDNDVSRLLQNVVQRFLDPTPFSMP